MHNKINGILSNEMVELRVCGFVRRAVFCLSTVALLGPAGAHPHSAYAAEGKAHTTWNAYEGGVDSAQYSALFVLGPLDGLEAA